MKKWNVSRETLENLRSKYPTPFYLYDEAGLRNTARRVKEAFSWEPGWREFFAIKALPNPAVLRIFLEEGLSLEAGSAPELELARMAGAGAKDILFSPNFPRSDDVRAAAGLGCMVNIDGLELVDFFAERGAVRRAVGLRVNPGGDFFIGDEKISSPAEAKFGLMPSQLPEALRKLKAAGADGFGLHGYMGGNIQNPLYWRKLAELLFPLGAQLHGKYGLPLAYINLSGGVGVGYRPGETGPDIRELSDSVRELYGEIFGGSGPKPALYTELGRYMSAAHGLLVCTVIHRKSSWKEYIGLDASAADLMRPMLYGAYHHISIPAGEGRPRGVFDVVGSVAENTDKFAIDRGLPIAEPGDIALIHDAGAHGHSMGYNYNGKLRPAELLMRQDGSFELIRRAETVEDYISTLKI